MVRYRMNRRQWELLGEALEGYAGFKGLNQAEIARIRYVRAMLSNGIATSAKIGLNKLVAENDQLLAKFITHASRALLAGYRDIPLFEGEERREIENRLKEIIDT